MSGPAPTVTGTDHSVGYGGSGSVSITLALLYLHTGPHFLLFLDELDLVTVKENPALSLKLSCMMTHGYGYTDHR